MNERQYYIQFKGTLYLPLEVLKYKNLTPTSTFEESFTKVDLHKSVVMMNLHIFC